MASAAVQLIPASDPSNVWEFLALTKGFTVQSLGIYVGPYDEALRHYDLSALSAFRSGKYSQVAMILSR